MMKVAIKIIFVYMMSGIILVMYHSFGHYESNGHIPFSGFPWMLVYAPIAPFYLFDDGLQKNIDEIIVFFVSISMFIGIMFRKNIMKSIKKGT